MTLSSAISGQKSTSKGDPNNTIHKTSNAVDINQNIVNQHRNFQNKRIIQQYARPKRRLTSWERYDRAQYLSFIRDPKFKDDPVVNQWLRKYDQKWLASNRRQPGAI